MGGSSLRSLNLGPGLHDALVRQANFVRKSRPSPVLCGDTPQREISEWAGPPGQVLVSDPEWDQLVEGLGRLGGFGGHGVITEPGASDRFFHLEVAVSPQKLLCSVHAGREHQVPA